MTAIKELHELADIVLEGSGDSDGFSTFCDLSNDLARGYVIAARKVFATLDDDVQWLVKEVAPTAWRILTTR